jgi:hypothetical protein
VKQLEDGKLQELFHWDSVEGKRCDGTIRLRVDEPIPLTGDIRVEAYNKALMVKKVNK